MNYCFKTFQKGAALKQKLNSVKFFHLLKDRMMGVLMKKVGQQYLINPFNIEVQECFLLKGIVLQLPIGSKIIM